MLAMAPAMARAAAPAPGPPLTIQRASGPIAVDGDLSDAGWQGLPAITTWYETRVGDNVEPQVKNLAYLTYDANYFYAGFVLDDPAPTGIRGPLGDVRATTWSCERIRAGAGSTSTPLADARVGCSPRRSSACARPGRSARGPS